MELMTEVPTTGTHLKIDTDRQFEGQPGDSVLRISGERDGSNVFDSTYIESSPTEAYLIAWLLRSIQHPSAELLEKVAQELQAVFASKLSGRDALQGAQVTWTAIREQVHTVLGVMQQNGEKIEKLAERFERASARGQQPYGGSSSYEHQPQGQTSSRSSRN